MIQTIKPNEIGGAIVRRVFSSGGKQMMPGTKLSREEVLQMPAANRNALADKKYIDLFPVGLAGAAKGGERFVISTGFGKYHVYEGRKLTEKAVEREEAYALAGLKIPEKPGRKAEK